MDSSWESIARSAQAQSTFSEIEERGPPARPLEFPPPVVHRGVRVQAALVIHPETGSRQVLRGVLHRESSSSEIGPEQVAYWPQKQLQEAIYGSVWACLVLRRHYGPASEEAAMRIGVEPNSASAPIVWEITGEHVAIKMMLWSRIHRMRGRQLEDPVKEIAAMQLLGKKHPNVLWIIEVLQDDEYLYCVMPYCKGGDLFGVVIEYTENGDSEQGMPENVARFWFKQILLGLAHLQANGICHRDLSLENILVDEDNCLIIDMGMCLRVPYSYNNVNVNVNVAISQNANITNTNTNPFQTTDVQNGTCRRLILPQGTCGKHNYMSPEIFRNAEPFDPFAIDLWAAAVILYIMITGFPPYDQASPTDQRFLQIVSGTLLQQLDAWEVAISPQAADLLQKMLQLNPRNRLTLRQVMLHPWVVCDDIMPPPPPTKHPWQR